MPKYSVSVVEQVTVRYPVVEIEAEDEQDAKIFAEIMLADEKLGKPYEHVDRVDYVVSTTS